jgi:hypothetical protein
LIWDNGLWDVDELRDVDGLSDVDGLWDVDCLMEYYYWRSTRCNKKYQKLRYI